MCTIFQHLCSSQTFGDPAGVWEASLVLLVSLNSKPKDSATHWINLNWINIFVHSDHVFVWGILTGSCNIMTNRNRTITACMQWVSIILHSKLLCLLGGARTVPSVLQSGLYLPYTTLHCDLNNMMRWLGYHSFSMTYVLTVFQTPFCSLCINNSLKKRKFKSRLLSVKRLFWADVLSYQFE